MTLTCSRLKRWCNNCKLKLIHLAVKVEFIGLTLYVYYVLSFMLEQTTLGSKCVSCHRESICFESSSDFALIKHSRLSVAHCPVLQQYLAACFLYFQLLTSLLHTCISVIMFAHILVSLIASLLWFIEHLLFGSHLHENNWLYLQMLLSKTYMCLYWAAHKWRCTLDRFC